MQIVTPFFFRTNVRRYYNKLNCLTQHEILTKGDNIMYKEYPTFYWYEVYKYGRKSRFDDPYLSVEEVLEKHNRMLDEYAEKHLGGPIPPNQNFQEVVSGESIKDRPEMTRLLKAIESPDVKAILTIDVQRLSRGDLEDAGRLIKLLRYTETYVITPYKIYDLRDEFDRDAFERELKRGNEYLEYFKKITLRGKLDSIRAGNYIGSVAPYGFDRTVIEDGNKTYHTLKERKDQADIVRLVFKWYCEDDIGVTAICRRLEDLGVKTKTGGSIWRAPIIFSMLENVHYIGCVRWNWRKTIKIIEDQEIKKLRPKAKVDEYLIFEGKHNGIISEELFYRAREIKGNRHRTGLDTTLKNPLAGIMFCKTCGSKIGYNTYVKNGIEFAKPKLRCNNQVHCKSGSVPFDEAIDYIRKTIKDCIADFKLMIKNDQDDSIKLHKDLVVELKNKLKELEEKEVDQWEAQYDRKNPMPPHIFEKLNKKLLKEKEEVKKALEKAEDSIPQEIDYRDRIVKFTDALKKLDDPKVDAKTKNQYLKDIIDRIDFDRPPNVKITNKNKHEFGYDKLSRKNVFHTPPYKISIKLKY